MSLRSFIRRFQKMTQQRERVAIKRRVKTMPRRAARKVSLIGEVLETRTAPAVTVSYLGGALTVDADYEDVTITSVGGNVYVNGTDSGYASANITSLAVNAYSPLIGYYSQTIDLRGIIVPGPFSSLADGAVTVNAGDGDDTVYGSDFGDYLYGYTGYDYINGGAGPDSIYGYTGDDTLLGGTQDDFIKGYFGYDHVDGGAGEDTLYGGYGDDTVLGGTEDDTIYADAGNDYVDGGSGDNLIYGYSGNDTVLAGTGNDSIYGGYGDDSITSGLGDDYIGSRDYTFGNDNIVTSLGNDSIVADFGDYIHGGAGDDDVTLYGTAGADTYTIAMPGADLMAIETLVVDAEAGNDDITVDTTFAPTTQVTILGGDGYDTLTMVGGPAAIYGDGEDDYIYGGDGDDSIYGGAGNDSVYGGLGDDFIDGEAGYDYLNGDDGADTIYGGTAYDKIYGDAGEDILHSDDDTAGGDKVYGDADDDKIYADNGDIIYGGTENDTAYIYGTPLGELIAIGTVVPAETTPVTDVETINVYGLGGNDLINIYASAPTIALHLYGQDGDDTIVSSGADATITGGIGADSIVAYGDAEDVFGGDGNDTISTGAGDDTVHGEDGLDSILGGDGYDSLSGGGNDDTVDGGSDDDSIFGGAGDDSLIGGLGDDYIYGNDGDDTFELPAGKDYISDTDGNDTLDFSSATAGVTIDLDDQTFQYVNVALDGVLLDGQFENFVGSGYDDTVALRLLTSPRNVLGGAPVLPPGDEMIVGVNCSAFTDSGGTAGTITGMGFAPLTYTSIETKTFTDTLPSASINDVTLAEGDSGTTNFIFTVTLTSGCSETITIDYDTADGSATTADNDYEAASGTLTFAPGDTSETITVVVNGDTTYELPNPETFVVDLSNAVTSSAIVVPLTDDQGLGSITNDDPVPSISIDNVSLDEGDSGTTPFIFTVSLSNPSFQTITVDFATAPVSATAPSDYTTTSGTLTFAPGETTKTITVDVNGDTTSEANETFNVNLSSPTTLPNVTIADGLGVGTIINDDAAISINDVSQNEGDSGTTNFVFTVTLLNATSQTVTVNYTTADNTAFQPTDYATTSGTLTFVPGDTSETITVVVNGDTLFEADETFFVNLSGALSTPGGGVIVSDTQGLGTILNDDPAPEISIADLSQAEGNSGFTNFNFTVSLNVISGLDTIVTFTTANGTASAPGDYTTTNGTLTIPAGNLTGTITVPVVGDTVDELNETFFVNLTGATNGTIVDNQALGTIVNDDAPPISINDVSCAEGNTGTTPCTFTVTLAFPSVNLITVDYATSDNTANFGLDYTFTSGTLTFIPGDTTETITVPVIGDNIFELNETFFVLLSNAPATTIADGQGVGTILDDDPQPTITINDVAQNEGDVGFTPFVFTASLSNPSAFPITVAFATANGTAIASSDYIPAFSSITFAPGITSRTITISVVGDIGFEANETFSVNLSNATDGVGTVSEPTLQDSEGVGTILNDDPGPAGHFQFSAGAYTVNENGGTATITITRTDGSFGVATVAFTTSNGTATAGFDYTDSDTVVTFASGQTSRTIDVPIIDDTINPVAEGNETILLNLSTPTGGTFLGTPIVATLTIVDNEVSTSFPAGLCFLDTDGDKYCVKLRGPGTASVTQNDPDGDGRGPINSITLINTTAASTLNINVKKAPLGNGKISVQQITGISTVGVPTPSLRALRAAKADLAGSGLNLTGTVGQIQLANLLNGSDIVVTGNAAVPMSLKLGQIGDFSDITTGSPIRSLTALNALNSSITTPSINILRTTSGFLVTDITVTGAVKTISTRGGGGGSAGGSWSAATFGNIRLNGGGFDGSIVSSAANDGAANTHGIGTLTIIGGNFEGILHALDTINTITLKKGILGNGGNIANATIAAAAINKILVAGNLTDALILAGANLGADHEFGGAGANADTFGAGSIGSFGVQGSVVSSVVGAGLNPVDGAFNGPINHKTPPGNDVIVSPLTSAINAFTIGGTASADSYFAAGVYPNVIKIDGVVINPVADLRFL